MGYDTNTHRAHGFRTTASTNLNEQGFDDRWIEKQLAHEIENKVTASYNKAEYFEDRKAMMQSWSDYLEELMRDAN